MTRCSMIHVHPDENGMAVEQPCPNAAAYQLGDDTTWVVCESCLQGLRDEQIEEAEHPRPLTTKEPTNAE